MLRRILPTRSRTSACLPTARCPSSTGCAGSTRFASSRWPCARHPKPRRGARLAGNGNPASPCAESAVTDPIVDELRKHRAEHARQLDFDLRALGADIHRVKANCARTVVGLPPRMLDTDGAIDQPEASGQRPRHIFRSGLLQSSTGWRGRRHQPAAAALPACSASSASHAPAWTKASGERSARERT